MSAYRADMVARFSRWRMVLLRETSAALLYVCVAATVSAAFLTAWGRSIGENLPATLAFSTQRPFAYRVLTPWILDHLFTWAPRGRLEAFLHKPLNATGTERVVDAALQRYHFPPELDVELLLLDLFFVCVLVATAYVMRASLRWLALPRLLIWLGPAVFLLLLPLHFAGGGYIYDLPELLLASLATLTFLKRRWLVYYPTVVFAVLNKEASILLIGFCFAFALAREWQLLARHLGLHALFALPPFLAVRLAFADAPGVGVMNYAAHNLSYLFSLAPYTARARVMHPLLPLPQSLNLLLLALGAVFVFHHFRTKPLVIRGAFLGTLLLVAPLFLLFGWENEIRVFAICFPSAFMLGAHTVAEMTTDTPLPSLGTEPRRTSLPG